jgi:hypothetical protein
MSAAAQSRLPKMSDAIWRVARFNSDMGFLVEFAMLHFVRIMADTVLEPAATRGICSLSSFFLGYLPYNRVGLARN